MPATNLNPSDASANPQPNAADPPPGKVLTIDIGGTKHETPLAENAAHAEPSPDGAAAEQAIVEQAVEDAPEKSSRAPAPPASILAIDIGGTKVKILATGQTEPRKAPTGKEFTPSRLIETVRELADEWEYEAITIGYPGLVGFHGPRSEPGNLGPGWVGFDFAAAFGKPVKMINDAAMQALGSYEGGRMLFLGLGTGLGSTLITGNVIVPMELGRLIYDSDHTLGQILGRQGLKQVGKHNWRKAVTRVVAALMGAFVVDYVVIGGGNAKQVKDPPPGARLGHNLTAFRGGFRLWSVEDAWVLAASSGESPQSNPREALRLL